MTDTNTQTIPAKDGTPLDPGVVALAKAIRQHESGNDYSSKGASGEFGAYQYTAPTWKADAKKYLGDENAQPTPENQDKAAYYSIKAMKDAGKTPEQVASVWNSGDENAYLNDKKGTNSYGVKYDVPAYVKNVIGIYKGFKDQALAGTQTAEASGGAPTDTTPAPAPQKSFLEKTGDVLGSIFGGNKIGEAIGAAKVKNDIMNGNLGITPVDYSKLSPAALARLKAQGVPTNEMDARKALADSVSTPTTKELLGDTARIALNFIPAGEAVEGAKAGMLALGAGEKIAPTLAKVAVGAGVGYGADVSNNFANGKSGGEAFKPGVGTLLGGALPMVAPAFKGAKNLLNEAIGTTTGVNGKAVTEFQNAIMAGGEQADAARAALRKQITPEQIVGEAKDALGQVIKERGTAYNTELAKLKTNTAIVDHSPVIEAFNKKLEDFGVFPNADGTPNFSRAPGLGRYEKDLTALSKTLSEWGTRPNDNTIAGIDKLKQVIDDYHIGSNDSKKFDNFVTELRGTAKDTIVSQLKKNGDTKALASYTKLTDDYATKTKDIREIQKQLSLGDKASTDTAFRKLTTVLRTNNEMRDQTVQRLNDLTGGKLLAKVAGQQMSELAPRGLIGKGADLGLASGALLGHSIVSLLPAALLTSPRAMGEIISALGIPASKASLVTKALLEQIGTKASQQLMQQGILFGSSAAKK
jgi:hypothetical protein